MQMFYELVADGIVMLHMLFILFVVSGGFLALRWLKMVYLHIPAVVWGVYIEFSGAICPLTPLENWFRLKSGQIAYEGDFIERYIIPIIYPANLTRELQVTLGVCALLINLLAYGLLISQRRKGGRK